MMFMIWFLGFVSVIVARIIYAGMKWEEKFYSLDRYGRKKEPELDYDKLMPYGFTTFAIALFWLFVVPAYGLFLLGRKIGRKNNS